MDILRVMFAVALFCISLYLAYDLIANGFNVYVLLGGLAGFIAAKHVWPNGYKEDRPWYECLELIVYLPYQAIAFTLRSIGRIVKSDDGGIGLD